MMLPALIPSTGSCMLWSIFELIKPRFVVFDAYIAQRAQLRTKPELIKLLVA